ncbi:taurine ABC transporter substrate-binding protein, partial [Halobacillus sp. BBL2006]
MKKAYLLFIIPLFLFVIMLSGCGSDVEETGQKDGQINDQVSEDNPSGDLAPLEKKTTVVIAEDGAASGAGFYIA